MGIKHGKERGLKHHDSHGSTNSTVQYDTSWIDTIGRSFVVVWCDKSIGLDTNADDDTNTLLQLATIVNKKRQLVHTFNEIDGCKNFISHANNVFLIVSGQMGLELVPLVHNLDQIHSIYIFCINKPKYDAWAKQYKKIRGVYTDIRDICECLKTYFISKSSSDYNQLQFDFLNKDTTYPTNDKREFAFIYPLISKIILLNMNSIKVQDMINYCRMEYTSDYQIQLINEIEKIYSQHDPIWWCTRDDFFQGIINRALQIHDLYTLCSMAPFIKDLDNKIAQLHKKQKTSSSTTLNLYSTHSISIDDFNKLKLNIGGLLCINQYISANTDQNIALLFIDHKNSTVVNSNTITILFQISIPQTIDPIVSYANIGAISQFVHQKEYLISMSSMYRVEKVEQLIEVPSGWVAHLTLIDKNDPQLNPIMQLVNKDNSVSKAGPAVTEKLYQFKSARKLFEQTLSFKSKQIRPVSLHYNMGVIYDCLNVCDKALEEYNYAKSLIRNFLPDGHQKDHFCLVPLYSNIGLTYQQFNLSGHAFTHAFRAIGISPSNQESPIIKNEILASSHFTLGLILDLQKKYSEALIHYEQALKYRLEYLSTNHPDVISLKNTITSLTSDEAML